MRACSSNLRSVPSAQRTAKGENLNTLAGATRIDGVDGEEDAPGDDPEGDKDHDDELEEADVLEGIETVPGDDLLGRGLDNMRQPCKQAAR